MKTIAVFWGFAIHSQRDFVCVHGSNFRLCLGLKGYHSQSFLIERMIIVSIDADLVNMLLLHGCHALNACLYSMGYSLPMRLLHGSHFNPQGNNNNNNIWEHTRNKGGT